MAIKVFGINIGRVAQKVKKMKGFRGFVANRNYERKWGELRQGMY